MDGQFWAKAKTLCDAKSFAKIESKFGGARHLSVTGWDGLLAFGLSQKQAKDLIKLARKCVKTK